MIIVVVPMATLIFTQGIFNATIRGGNGVDDTFFYKALKGTVNGNPI